MKQRPDWARANSGTVWGRVFRAEGTENAKSWEGNRLGVAKEQKGPTEAEAQPASGKEDSLGRGDGSGLELSQVVRKH